MGRFYANAEMINAEARSFQQIDKPLMINVIDKENDRHPMVTNSAWQKKGNLCRSRINHYKNPADQ